MHKNIFNNILGDKKINLSDKSDILTPKIIQDFSVRKIFFNDFIQYLL